MKQAFAVTFCLLCLFCTACATTTILYGDRDGFGLGVKAGEKFDHTMIDSRIAHGDGDGTDVYWNVPGGTDHYPWSFVYPPLDKPIKSATLEIFHAGVCHGSELFLDGHFIGRLTGGEGPERVGTWARIDRFNLRASVFHLLDGDNTVEIKTIHGGNIALDYLQFKVFH